MSVFTNFLNLFKYNPTTEGEQTFNIDTALNENWDKVDAETQRLNAEIVQVKNDLQNVDVDVSWADVTSKPTTFPATTHGHAWGDLTSIPSTFTPAAHNQAWSTITGTPRNVYTVNTYAR